MPFAPGDVIQDYEEPFLKYLIASCKNSRCNNCFKQVDYLQQCQKCKKVYYCSDECSEVDRKRGHSLECKLNDKYPELLYVNDSTDQIVRLMCYLRLDQTVATKKSQLYNGSQRCFNDLVDHFNDLKNNSEISKAMKSLATKLSASGLFSTVECSYDGMMRMYGVWKVNAFSIANEDDTEIIGSALYVLSSFIDHSCRPNAIRVMDESFRMQIRCIYAIADGDAPRITYLAGMRDRKLRQKELKELYHFDCGCVSCEVEKQYPDVDYRALTARCDAFKRREIHSDTELNEAKNILKEMAKLYWPYDERITNFYNDALSRLLATLWGPYNPKPTIANIKRFAQQVEERLRITFGTDHRDYKYFSETIAPRLERM
ncbi:hypothetical protein HA402_009174 [Bradysia odoriphaga]|nr:hypothetical protein HA402_009174 [Bradysia odoriphaga]